MTSSGAALRQPPERRIRIAPFPLIVGTVVAITSVLVLYPLARLLWDVFFATGDFTTRAITETLASPELPAALASTALLIGAAGPLSLAIGATLAWLNERTDARMGWAADTLQVIPLLVPALAVSIGWVFLLAPRAGFLNVAWRWAFGGEEGVLGSGPLNIYGAAGMIWVTAVVTVPLAYLIISAALRNMDPGLEEAARMSGANPFHTLRTVTLPAIRNTLATAAVLVLIGILSQFSVPVIIGSQGGIDVLAVLIFRTMNAPGGVRFDQMIVLSTFMLAAVQLAILAEYAITRSGQHAKLGGRGRSQTRYELGVWRVPARALTIAYVAAATLLPLAALALVSLQGFWSPVIQWGRLSFANYVEMFGATSALGRAFMNSLGLGVATATLLTVIGAILAYYVATATGFFARVVNAITALPAGVPHVVTGVGFLLAFGSGRLSLQGTLVLLLLAYVVLALPQASRSAGAALSQVGRELWEGSLMAGASHLRTFARIVLPLMAPGLLAGWVISFVYTFSETSASAFLSSPAANPVSGPVIVSVFYHSGTFPQIAALTLAGSLVQITTVVLVQLAGRSRVRL